MYLLHAELPPECSHSALNPADTQPTVRRTQGNKECILSVDTAVQICLQMNLRSCIEVNNALLIPFTEYNAFTFVKIHIITIQTYHLTDTHPCRCEHINHRQIPQLMTAVPHRLQLLIAIGRLDVLRCLDPMNAAHGTFYDIVLILKPRKEARQDAAHIIHGNTAQTPALLIRCQVSTQILRCRMNNCLLHRLQHSANRLFVIIQSFHRTALNALRLNEFGYKQITLILH